MKKDYAKRLSLYSEEGPAEKRTGSVPILILSAMGCLAIVCAVIGYVNKEALHEYIAKMKAKTVNQTSALATAKQTVIENKEPELHFTFYNELPSMRVATAKRSVSSNE